MSGFEKTINLTRMFMRLIGIWPDDSTSHNWRSLKVYLFNFLIFFFLLYPQTQKLWFVKNQLDEVIQILTFALFPVTLSCFWLAFITYKQKDIRFILKMMELDWKTKDKRKLDEMWKNVRFVRFGVRFFLYLTIFSTVIYTLGNLYKNNFDKDTKKQYYVQSEFFFSDSQTSPIYEIIWFIQCVTCCLSIYNFAVLNGFYLIMVNHLCIQIKILRLDIRKLVSKDAKNNLSQGIIPIVNRLIHLKKFVCSLEKIFSIGLLIQFFLSSIMISFLGYTLMIMLEEFRATSNIIMVILCILVNIFTSLFLCCTMGEKIRIESDKLAYELYCISWYKLTLKESKILLIMMAASGLPFEINVGKIAVLSHEHFVVILNTAYGYFTMLLTLRNK